MNNNQVVAFLDLLGFSALLKKAPEIAFDNMNSFQLLLETRYMDDKTHPREEYAKNSDSKDFLRFVDSHSVSSFKQVITFSDSLVIGSDEPGLFVWQLGNYVANLYIRYSSQFAKISMETKEITDIRSDLLASYKNGVIQYNNSFPVLFRGGVAMGKEVFYWDEMCIRDGEIDFNSRDVGGRTYLEAVKLEKYSAGPRLFCHKDLVDACDDKYMFAMIESDPENQKADEECDTYEILWPLMGCECGEKSSEAKWNINRAIMQSMIPPAANLYKYYETQPDLEEQVKHYKALLELIIKGIIRYGEINQAEEYVREQIRNSLKKMGLQHVVEGLV